MTNAADLPAALFYGKISPFSNRANLDARNFVRKITHCSFYEGKVGQAGRLMSRRVPLHAAYFNPTALAISSKLDTFDRLLSLRASIAPLSPAVAAAGEPSYFCPLGCDFVVDACATAQVLYCFSPGPALELLEQVKARWCSLFACSVAEVPYLHYAECPCCGMHILTRYGASVFFYTIIMGHLEKEAFGLAMFWFGLYQSFDLICCQSVMYDADSIYRKFDFQGKISAEIR